MPTGEVFVLDDGGEADLDLGNYERYLDVTLSRDNNITTGKIYQFVIEKEVSTFAAIQYNTSGPLCRQLIRFFRPPSAQGRLFGEDCSDCASFDRCNSGLAGESCAYTDR